MFTIGDETEHSDAEEGGSRGQRHEIEELSRWKARLDVKHSFECQAVTSDARLIAAHLLVTPERLYSLVEVRGRKGRRNMKQRWVRLWQERLLCTIIKITSRRSLPELITFKFGDFDRIDTDDDVEVVAADRYIIPNAGDATKVIKQLVVQADEKRQREYKERKETAQTSADNAKEE